MNRFPTLFAITASIIAATVSSAQDERPDEKDPEGMIPVQATVLINTLPPKPSKWELKRSTGETRFGEWLETRVVRIYEKVVPPEEEGGSEIIQTARITITDTAKFPSALTLFTDFAPGKEDNFEKKYIDKMPAILTEFSKDDFEVEVLANERFIIQYALEKQPVRYLREWMRNTDFEALDKIEDSKIVPLPEELTVVKIDQLNEKKNKAYSLATTSNVQLAKDLAADELYEKKLLGEIPALPEEFDLEPTGPDAQ